MNIFWKILFLKSQRVWLIFVEMWMDLDGLRVLIYEYPKNQRQQKRSEGARGFKQGNSTPFNGNKLPCPGTHRNIRNQQIQ